MKKSVKLTTIILSAMLLAGTAVACSDTPLTQEFKNTGDLFDRPTVMDTLPVPADLSGAKAFSNTVEPVNDQFELSSWTAFNYTEITLADGASSVTKGGDYQAGVTVNGDEILITSAGVYSLTGKLTDGRVVVAKRDNVKLVLNGVDITCKTSAPLLFLKGELKVLTLADGTENSLTDAEQYTKFYDNDNNEVTILENKINGCLYSQHELTINGSGSLLINANYGNGISGKSKVKIQSGKITVSAKNNGIRAKAVDVEGGDVVVADAGNDGIKSTIENDVEETEGGSVETPSGYINILGGKVCVNAVGDGIQAESLLRIGGTETIVNVKSGNGADATVDPLVSSKGLKSGVYVLIEGGDITVNSSDDAIHSDLGVVMTGGKCNASTASRGIDAIVGVSVTGGKMEIVKSADGVEALSVSLTGGTLKLTSSGNGIKCEYIDPASTIQSDADCSLIVGGSAVVDISTDGDAIESDGKVLISGGELFIDGPTQTDKSTIEAKGGVAVNGGSVVACGPLGRVQDPVIQSTANTVSLALGKNLQAGSVIKLCDANGKILLSRELAKICRGFMFADSRITAGGSYAIFVNDEEIKRFTVEKTHSLIGANV